MIGLIWEEDDKAELELSQPEALNHVGRKLGVWSPKFFNSED